MAAAFADSAPDGSTVTFILPELPRDNGDDEGGEPPVQLPGSCGSCRIRYVESRAMTSLKALQVGLGCEANKQTVA